MNSRTIQLLLVLLTIVILALVVFNASGWLLFLLLLILLLLLLWWLFGSATDTERNEFPNPDYPPEQFFVQNEVVIRGPLADVERALAATTDSVQLQRKNRIQFSELDSATRDCLGGCSEIDFADFVIDLYELNGSYEDVAAAVRAINQAVGNGSDVQAEPNWLSGQPWVATGSPWVATGSPWVATGSGTSDEQAADPNFFMKQWAFSEIGLHKKDDYNRGRGVRIGVFDTSPYPTDTEQVPSWVNEPNQLALELAQYPVPATAPDDLDLSSHGLFASGLVHAIAPDAHIQLIRVLGNHNVGDLFTLNVALFEFIKAHIQDSDVIGAVINLSLGIRVPPDEAQFNLPATVQSLRDLLRAAQCAQIVVVAAAGNNSANLPQPEPANLPANWPEIIGIASSTQTQDRSCFSNQGNIAAPGGNGRSDKDNQCAPANHTCNSPDCPYAIIGPVLKTDKNTGFAYWSGTSFAAPLVTGLAALVIEKGDGKLSPQEVRRIIECGATEVPQPDLGNRIIHVANTLANFEECAKKQGITLSKPREES